MLIGIFKKAEEFNNWMPVIHALQRYGLEVWGDVKADDLDISIILGGKLENPLAVPGRRILVFNQDEWTPKGRGWKHFWHGVLKHYYHDLLDVTGCETPNDAADEIIKYMETNLGWSRRETN